VGETVAAFLTPQLDLRSILFLLFSAALAGLARGFAGFGTALIFMPLAATVVPPQIAAPLLLGIDIVGATPLIPRNWRESDRRKLVILLCGAVFGVPVGVFALKAGDPLVIRWVIVAFVFVTLPLLISGWRMRAAPTVPLTLGVGVASGFLGGMTQTSGPPIIAYWLGQNIGASVARASMFAYFGLASFITAGFYLAGGLVTIAVVQLVIVLTPVYGLAILIGQRMFGFASERTFRLICYVLIALVGLFSMPLLDGIIR
jgi:uncharacterized membrane protein YfcA